MNTAQPEPTDWIDKIFWPHPFKGSSRPLQIATTGDTNKVFVNSYSGVKSAIQKQLVLAKKSALEDVITQANAFEEYRQDPDPMLKIVNQIILKRINEIQTRIKELEHGNET